MPRSSRRRSAIKAAIDEVLLRFSALPSTPEVDALRARAEEYRRQADDWSLSPPSAEEIDKFMERLGMLHVEVGKLERESGTDVTKG
jgi:hypothetical protein